MTKIIFLFSLVIGLQANAGFLVEPYLGYDMGTQKVTAINGTDSSSKSTGSTFGAYLGYRFPSMFWLAADVASSSGTVTPNDTATATYKYADTSTGVALGFQLKMLRLELGYAMSDNFESKTTIPVKFKGTNTKIGLGVIVANHVSLNFAYVIQNYTKYDIPDQSLTDKSVSDLYSTLSPTVLRVGISFPFDFGGK